MQIVFRYRVADIQNSSRHHVEIRLRTFVEIVSFSSEVVQQSSFMLQTHCQTSQAQFKQPLGIVYNQLGTIQNTHICLQEPSTTCFGIFQTDKRHVFVVRMRGILLKSCSKHLHIFENHLDIYQATCLNSGRSPTKLLQTAYRHHLTCSV